MARNQASMVRRQRERIRQQKRREKQAKRAARREEKKLAEAEATDEQKGPEIDWDARVTEEKLTPEELVEVEVEVEEPAAP